MKLTLWTIGISISIVLCGIFAGYILGYCGVLTEERLTGGEYIRQIQERIHRPFLAILKDIIPNNLTAWFIHLAGNVTLGLSNLFSLLYWSFEVSRGIELRIRAGVPVSLIMAVLSPHMIPELLSLILVASLSFRSFFHFCRYLKSGKLPEKIEYMIYIKIVGVSFFLIIIAALIEASLTPLLGTLFITYHN